MNVDHVARLVPLSCSKLFGDLFLNGLGSALFKLWYLTTLSDKIDNYFISVLSSLIQKYLNKWQKFAIILSIYYIIWHALAPSKGQEAEAPCKRFRCFQRLAAQHQSGGKDCFFGPSAVLMAFSWHCGTLFCNIFCEIFRVFLFIACAYANHLVFVRLCLFYSINPICCVIVSFVILMLRTLFLIAYTIFIKSHYYYWSSPGHCHCLPLVRHTRIPLLE